mgnify:FL=1
MEKSVVLRDGSVLQISRPRGENAAEILEYLKIVGGETLFLLMDENGLGISEEREAKILEAAYAEPRGGMHFGKINREIACMFSLSCHPRRRLAHTGEIALSVRKKYWHIGVGSAIMEALIELAKEASLKNIELSVHAENERAIALYRRFGFEEIGRHRGKIYVDGEYYDEILMDLHIEADEAKLREIRKACPR